jgi:hypothetical protein
MIAGLPGTGIGGLYYLFAAGWMMVRACYARISRRQDLSRWTVVRTQTILTFSIVGGMWATGEVVGLILLLFPQGRSVILRSLTTHALAWTVTTLVALYLVLHVIRVLISISGSLNARRNPRDAEVAPANSGV